MIVKLKFFKIIEMDADDYVLEISNCVNFKQVNEFYYKKHQEQKEIY